MVLLEFQSGEERLSLDVSKVIEVMPVVNLKNAPHTPKYIAGLFNYRGTIVPVVDLSVLLSGKSHAPLLSTRIILVDYTGKSGSRHTLGLKAERVTETVSCREQDLQPPGVESVKSAYLGPILIDERGMIRLVEVNRLLPESLQKILFQEQAPR
jgi:chemotaxis-related protein WspB